METGQLLLYPGFHIETGMLHWAIGRIAVAIAVYG